jgi:Dyp-type peroxidase family
MVDESDVQGNVLFGYRYRTARFWFLEVTDAGPARAWLRANLLDRGLPTPGTWTAGGPGAVAVNVALTHGGLAALGVTPAYLATFPADFRQGLFRRLASELREPDAVDQWERHWYRHGGDDPLDASAPGPTDGHVHLLVSVHGDGPGARDLVRRLADTADRPGSGLHALGTTEAHVHRRAGDRNVEHFGFADGLSQPYLDGVDYRSGDGARRRVEGSGALAHRRAGRHGRRLVWRPLQPGEFVLGHPDEDLASPPLPRPVALVRNGSYLVYRRLRQDVDAFLAFGRDHPWPGGAGGNETAARLVGRHPDGTPLLPTDGGDPDRNGFAYGGDPNGYGCPRGSHIRRANPRDSLEVDPGIVNRHRMIRRGMPYGPPHRGAADGRDRGLIFMAYCASISRQFEFVQREWLGDANVFGQGHTRDVFAGPAPAFTIQHESCPVTLGAMSFVRPTGGGYFLQPGLRALAGLAAGDFNRL